MSGPRMRDRLLRDSLASALGVLTMLSLPPWEQFALGPIGLGLWLKFCVGPQPRWRGRLEVAVAFWLGAYLFGLFWMTELTVPGWIAAVPVEAFIMALPLSLIPPNGRWRAIGMPAALVLGEAVRWSVPFGGVPMSNLALGQVSGPLLGTAVLAGPLGVIALIGVGAVVIERLCARYWRGVWQPLLIAIGVQTLALVVPDTTVDQTITVAVTQAGGELGTHTDTPQRSVERRHFDTTAAWQGTADLLVWSESSNSADEPLETSESLAALESLAASRDLVLVANFYERAADGERFRNATVAIDPLTGLADRYDKAHLVPFGEYVPLRGIVEPFADLSLISREAIAGEGPGVLSTSLGEIAVLTSYEVYFSDLVRDGVRAQGRIVVNPTLASSYSTSVVPAQSLASARLRAVESGRWVVQSSTTGYSAIVSPDGAVVARSDLRSSVVLVGDVELRSGITPAVFLGSWPLAALAALVLMRCIALIRKPRNPAKR